MNIKHTYFLIFSVLFLQLTFCTTKINAKALLSLNIIQQDSVPFDEAKIEYKGYRIHLSDFEVLKEKTTNIKIQFNISNTGKFQIKTNSNNTLTPLVIKYDPSFESLGLGDYKKEIRIHLAKEALLLNPGQLIMNHQLKLTRKSMAPINVPQKVEPVVTVEKTTTQKTKKEDKKSKKEKKNKKEKEKEKEKPKKNKIRNKEIYKEEIVEKEIQEDTVKQNIETQELVIQEPVPTKEVIKEAIIAVTEEVKEKPIEELTIETQVEEKIEKPRQEPVQIKTIDAFSEEKIKEEKCPDLVIESIKVLKQSKAKIVVQYTITNYGRGTAFLTGDSKKEEDNIAIKAFLSSSEKINRGAITLGGSYLPENLGYDNGRLKWGESYTGIIKLDYRKRTRFTPYIVLTVDAFGAIFECNETNNNNSYLTE